MEGRHQARRPFPACELAVVTALGCGAAAVVNWGSPRSVWLIGAAVALACVGGLEVAWREHFGGRRSHSWLMAGAAAMALSTASFFTPLPPLAGLAAAITALVAGGPLLERAFVQRRGAADGRALRRRRGAGRAPTGP